MYVHENHALITRESAQKIQILSFFSRVTTSSVEKEIAHFVAYCPQLHIAVVCFVTD